MLDPLLSRACLYKVQIAINIASYRSGNETSKADIDTVHKCLGNTDLSIRLYFRLADCIFIPWQISHLRSAAVLRISSGSSRNAQGMSASVSTVVTEAWTVENYQQPGTVFSTDSVSTRAQARLFHMGGDHCHNSTRARFSYSGRAISYSGRAISYSGRAVSYSGRAVSYLGGAISLQLRNSTLGKNVLLQLRYRHDIT